MDHWISQTLVTSLMPTRRETPTPERSAGVLEESMGFRSSRKARVSNLQMTFSFVFKLVGTKLSLVKHATIHPQSAHSGVP